MSQDLLSLVKPPIETVKQSLPFPKSAEKPAEDFLAVLDRALSAKTSPIDASPSDATPVRHDERLPEPVRQAETADIGRERADAARDGQNTQTAAAIQAITDAQALASTRLEKSHGRQDTRPSVQTIPKADSKPHLSVVRADEQRPAKAPAEIQTRETMAQALSAQGLIQRQVAAVASTATNGREEAKSAQPASRKVNHKTNEPDAGERIASDRKKLAAAKSETANPSAGTKKPSGIALAGDGEAAAAKMQLHADTGGTKGLADALSVVKNLADKLGLGTPAADAGQTISRTIDLSRNPASLGLVKSAAPAAHGEAGDKVVAAKNSRVELLRAERLGRRDGGEALQQAADQGRVQVLDRSQPGKSSLVLESMLADKAKGQNGRSDEAGRKDSLQLINTAYLNPVNERNTVSIPVHLVASQNGNLAQALRSHLSEKGNSDIVQQARIIMNGKESGEIKLILKPENLGEVRIHLQMNDGHIAGQIFVENKEVQAAFQDNLQSLMQAFQDGGLQMGAMQVNVEQRNQGQPNQQDLADSRTSERQKLHAVRSLENSVATVTMAESSYSQVNLVV